ncbi:MAG: hypothetical protein R3Y09_00825 [Clostridia bacterium]
MEKICWNVFESTGDPMAYLIYTKSKNIDEYNKNMVQISNMKQGEKLIFLDADGVQ